MKKFWPNRSKARGFSIQNLALKYRLKISSLNSNTNEIPNQILNHSNTICIKEKADKVSISNLSIKRIHWANRDFSEYKRSA